MSSYYHPKISRKFVHNFLRYRAVKNSSKPGIERVQALADISHSVLCYHSNKTRAPIANPPNSAQLRHPYHSPKLHLGPCSSMGMRQGTDTRMGDQYTFRIVHDSHEM